MRRSITRPTRLSHAPPLDDPAPVLKGAGHYGSPAARATGTRSRRPRASPARCSAAADLRFAAPTGTPPSSSEIVSTGSRIHGDARGPR